MELALEREVSYEELEQAIQAHLDSIFGLPLFSQEKPGAIEGLKRVLSEWREEGLIFQGDNESFINSFVQTTNQLIEQYSQEFKQGDTETFFSKLLPHYKAYITSSFIDAIRQNPSPKIDMNIFPLLKDLFHNIKEAMTVVTEETTEEIRQDVDDKAKGLSYTVFAKKVRDFKKARKNEMRNLFIATKDIMAVNTDAEINQQYGEISADRVMLFAEAIIQLAKNDVSDMMSDTASQNSYDNESIGSVNDWYNYIEQILGRLDIDKKELIQENKLTPEYTKWNMELVARLIKLLPANIGMDYVLNWLQQGDYTTELDNEYKNYLIKQYQEKKINFNAEPSDKEGLLQVCDYLTIPSGNLTSQEKKDIINNFINLASLTDQQRQSVEVTMIPLKDLKDVPELDTDGVVEMTYRKRLGDDGIAVRPIGLTLDDLYNEELVDEKPNNLQYLLAKTLNLKNNLIDSNQEGTVELKFRDDQLDTFEEFIKNNTNESSPLRNLALRLSLYDAANLEIDTNVDIDRYLDQIENKDYDIQKLKNLMNQPLIPKNNQVDDELNQSINEFQVIEDPDNIVNVVMGQLREGDRIMLEKSKDLYGDIENIVEVVEDDGSITEYVFVMVDNVNSPCYQNND